jgi:hypothetical protein
MTIYKAYFARLMYAMANSIGCTSGLAAEAQAELDSAMDPAGQPG